MLWGWARIKLEPPPATPLNGTCFPGQQVSAWVYFCGHTGLESEFMLLGHYACSSILQRPAELSTPVKEFTSGLPGRGSVLP